MDGRFLTFAFMDERKKLNSAAMDGCFSTLAFKDERKKRTVQSWMAAF
ncbi:MAG TPA: hypothetical protein VMV99_00230 [Rhodanobacter sp.]|nr:hypothetical protein [Rhodanobacter sp.]